MSLKKQTVYIMLGGNEGKVDETFFETLQCIERLLGKVVKTSSIYQTQAWGPIPQADYLNMALMFQTTYSPLMVLQTLLKIESILGRKRKERYGPRTIDIDVIFYGNRKIKHPNLTIPHPELASRNFVLIPLNEIATNFCDPYNQLTVKQMLDNNQNDLLEVKLWKKL
jgi:2-amino-4-hydroxy-6-hydroxymethyldihydropteridine diphosphokinase